MPAALSYVYCTEDDVLALIGQEGQDGRVDDDNSGSISPAEQLYLTAAINRATRRVNQYLMPRYPSSELYQSGIVNEWCSVVAAYLLCCRRGNPAAGSIKDLYDETVEWMKEVSAGTQSLADAASRHSAFPSWANIRYRLTNPLRRLRVEKPISENRDPSTGKRIRDLAADLIVEPN